MKKVTVITLQNIRNYGSVLQALATQKLFEDLGCQVDFINYWRSDTTSLWKKACRLSEGSGVAKKLLQFAIQAPTHFRQKYVFENFMDKHLHVQKQKVSTEQDFKNVPITSDIYCTGSDQTWNSGWNQGIIPGLFLDFVPDSVKKIAYAASIGKNKFEDWEKEETAKLVKRYVAISVREKAAVDALDEIGYKNAVHVLDPTLQMTREYWLRLSTPPLCKSGYVLIYQLNKNTDFDKYAVKYAKRKGLKLLRLCFNYTQIRKCGEAVALPKIEEFISLIANADTVITDSFHATAFSINLNTSFIAIYPNEYSSRLASILELTELQDRHLVDYSDFSFADRKVDFTKANEILARERHTAVDFLTNAIKD